MSTPLTFDDLYKPPQRQPSVRERAADVGVRREEAEIPYAAPKARADVASTEATVEEKRTLLPARARTAEANATLAEVKAEQAKIALNKAKSLISSLPVAEKVPEARTILLRELRNLSQARELSDTMFSASGIGYNLLEGYSGSPAATVKGLLDPIVANEAFVALSKMRAESPTGGALGNVTERELDLLKAAGGYTPPTAGDTAFQQGIDDLIAKRIEVLNRLGASPAEVAQAIGPRYAEQFAPKIESYRFRKADEEALDNYVKTKMADGTFDPTDFAALMSQAYYNATGNQPDEAYVNSAFESAVAMQNEGRTTLGTLAYNKPDEDARQLFLQASGALKPDELSLGDALTGAAINFIPSTFQLAADTVQALTLDLPETIEGVAQIVGGATGLSDPAAWEAVKDYFGERYGSYDGFKRALKEDPASIAADVAGIATGGTLLAAKTASTAGKVSQIGALANAAKKAEDFGAIAAKLDPLNTAASLATFGAKAGARTAENLGVALPAKLLGVQTADVKQAADAGRRGSTEFRDTLEGRSPPEDAVAKAQSALTELYQSRSADYTRRMERLKKQPEMLDFADVQDAIDGVRTVGRHKGIDISGASGVWDEVDAKVGEFASGNLNSIEDFDAMKRAIGNIRDKYQRGTPEYKVANDVAKAINNTITEKAPIYANIMKDYRLASDTLSDIQASMSLGARSADTTLGKLRRTASERGPRGRSVLDILENTKAGRGLGDMLAAQNLGATEPSGLGATAGAVGAVGMGDPTLTAASAASPKMLGELAYKYGQGLGVVDKAREAVLGQPGVQQLADLADRYSLVDRTRTGVRVANPAVIQPQVDPMGETQPNPTGQTLEELIAAYRVAAPEPRGPLPGQVSLTDSAPKYVGPSLADTAPEAAEGETPAAGSLLTIDGREVVYDPTVGGYVDAVTGEAVAMKRGGAVKGYKRGGDVKPNYAKGSARAAAQGLTFGFGDEIEAGLRALAQADPSAYRREVQRIRREQAAYDEAYPLDTLGWEVAGAMPTALIPGAQGATAAKLARLAAKYPKSGALALGGVESVLYGAGVSEDVRGIPRSIADEAIYAMPMYAGAAMLAGPASRAKQALFAKYRNRKR